MRKKMALVLLMGIVITLITLTGCDSSENLAEPWAELSSVVSQRINVPEKRMLESLEKALDEGIDTGEDGQDIWRRVFSEVDYDALISWYQDRPEGLKVSGLYSVDYYGIHIDLLRSGSEQLLDSLAASVASELDINRQEVTDLFHQAMRELEDSRHKEALDTMVSEGHLTQEQADTYYRWFLVRPESVTPGRVGVTE
ncbi:MAG: hypothetical protein JW712_12630 [Dehalococcoidales bacterium]|nr:hypothetical protein [Dehalococcoidales bacterium]